MNRLVSALRPDSFTLMILATVGLASLVPASGALVPLLDMAVKASVMALFFLHGARLAREAVLQAIGHWRLQFLILGLTYLLFPSLALLSGPLVSQLLEPTLYLGFVFLCCLPSTVQSSLAAASAPSPASMRSPIRTPVSAGTTGGMYICERASCALWFWK